MNPCGPVCRILPELLRNCLVGSIRDLFVYADDEELLDAFVEEGVRCAIADALGSASHNSDLPAEVRHVFEREAVEDRIRGGISSKLESVTAATATVIRVISPVLGRRVLLASAKVLDDSVL
jgi:hypothetical protein